jgi:hypothetical protein
MAELICMEIESRTRQLPFEAQKVLQIRYKGHILKKEYIVELCDCFENLLNGRKRRSLTSKDALESAFYAQFADKSALIPNRNGNGLSIKSSCNLCPLWTKGNS